MSQSNCNSNSNSNLKMDGSNQLEDDESNAVTDYKYQYQQEISQMMFVFGDVVDPQPAVLQLVEDIVRTQVIEMVIQSKKLATRRSSRNLSPEDLLFLIRYDRAKVNRLRTYLSWKDVRKKAKDSEPGAGGAEPEVEVEDVAVENASKLAPKQVKLPWELSSLYSEHLQPLSSTSFDHNNLEELDVPDEDDIEAHEDSLARLRQADEATKGMTKEEYVHYSECRQASFTFKKAKKFREFIKSSNYLEVKPNDDIIDVLGFMAFEVVRELCLGAISLKKEEEEELNGKKTLNDDQGSDQEDDEEDEDEDAGDEEEEKLEKDEDDTFRTNGNRKPDGIEKGKEEDGTENRGVSVGNESVETAKGKEDSRSLNGKSRKRKVEEDEASSKESKKKTKMENGSSRKSRSISPVKQQRQTSPSKTLPLSPPEDPRSPKKSKKSLSSSSRKMTKSSSSSRGSEKGPFCSLFLPPENSDRPLLTSHVARAFSRLQKSKIFLQSSATVMAGGGGLRRTKVFVM